MTIKLDPAALHEMPPFADPDAERALLKAILRQPDCLDEVNRLLSLDDFALVAHRHLLMAIQRLTERGDPLTTPFLIADLERHRHRQAVAALNALSDSASDDDADPEAHLNDDLQLTLAANAERLKSPARLRQLLTWLQAAPARLTDGEDAAPLLAEGHDLFAACRDDVTAPPGDSLYDSLEDLMTANLDQTPEVIAGLQPGEVGVLFADARLAPVSFLTQLGLALAGGDTAAPLLAANLAPHRVLYLNSRWRLWHWRELLKGGLTHFPDATPARDNFMPMVAGDLHDPVINLARAGQAQRFVSFLKRQQPGFVLIDSLTALHDEVVAEYNARHYRMLLQRLKQVARQTNCVILITETIRRGDGGGGRRTTLAGLADTVYRLEADKRQASRAAILRCEKSRGALPPALVLQSDDKHSWFTISEEPPPEEPPPTLDELVAYVAANNGAHTAEIINHFANRAASRTIAYLLQDAEQHERLVKERHKGAWQVCRHQELMQPVEQIPETYTGDSLWSSRLARLQNGAGKDARPYNLLKTNPGVAAAPPRYADLPLPLAEPAYQDESSALKTAAVSTRSARNHLSRNKKKKRRR